MTIRERLGSVRRRWPATRRRQVATVLALVAIVLATFIASSRLLRFFFDGADVLAYLGLFVACWVGAGGALVPVPGVRPLSWLMVIQQAAALSVFLVIPIAALAMTLGQSTYFLATQAAIRRHERGEARADDPDDDAGTVAAAVAMSSRVAVPPDGPDEPDEAAPSASGDGLRGRIGRARTGVESRVEHHAVSTAFLVSAFPSPLTTIATTASASAGTTYARWVAPAFAGYLAFNLILGLLGQGLLVLIRSIFP